MSAELQVHSVATNFNKQVDAYEAARPTYPRHLVELVLNKNGIKEGSVVLDLAAGNGKLTRILAEFKLNLVAVEPVEGMRNGFTKVLPNIPIQPGTASSIPFPDAHFDTVFVGQAFHWFAKLESLREIRRVLKPGGALILIWNNDKFQPGPWFQSLIQMYLKYEGDAPQYHKGKWREPFEDPLASKLFTPLQDAHDHWTMKSDLDLIWLRILSRSYISALDKEIQDSLKKDTVTFLRENVPEFNPNLGGKDSNQVEIPMVTDVFWCKAV